MICKLCPHKVGDSLVSAIAHAATLVTNFVHPEEESDDLAAISRAGSSILDPDQDRHSDLDGDTSSDDHVFLKNELPHAPPAKAKPARVSVRIRGSDGEDDCAGFSSGADFL